MNFDVVLFSQIMNIVLVFIIFIILKFNPYKPNLFDIVNWVKLKVYKNPSIHRIINGNAIESEHIINGSIADLLEKKYGKKMCAYIMNARSRTFRNKVPIYTHVINSAEQVDFFNDKAARNLNSEKFENIISMTKMASSDIIKKLLHNKDFLKYLMIIAFASGAAAFFGFQILNQMNNLNICVLPGTVLT